MQPTNLPTMLVLFFATRRPLTSWKPWFGGYQRTSSVLSGGHTSLESWRVWRRTPWRISSSQRLWSVFPLLS